MSTSTIKIYKTGIMNPSKNYIIEDISTWLSSYLVATITDFQYIKHSLLLNIKINKDQADMEFISANRWDYVSIENQVGANTSDRKKCYYFIIGRSWKSENTIELQLSMDTLNTFTWNTDYIPTDKTLVMREHKDRVKLWPNSTLLSPAFQRIIDLKPEGINPPLYKRDEMPIYRDNDSLSWILYYRNKNPISTTDYEGELANNPIECFIAPTQRIKGRYYSGSPSLTNASFPSGYTYIIGKDMNISILGIETQGNSSFDWEIYKDSSNKLTIKQCFIEVRYYPPLTWTKVYRKVQIATNLTSFEVVNPYPEINAWKFTGELFQPTFTDYPDNKITLSVAMTEVDYVLRPEVIDRTDSRNIKIIELPYAPSDIEYDNVNDVYLFGPMWTYDTTQKLFKLTSLNNKFDITFFTDDTTMNPMDVLLIDNTTEPEEKPSASQPRKDYMESKVYNSEFYRPKFVYDAFSLEFFLELVDFTSYYSHINGTLTPLEVRFVASTNVISKFLFQFPQYITKYGVMDYDNICAVSRNNEQVIYNSTYLNYIRNGYNYDIKSKNRAEATGGIGLGLSSLSTLVGVIGGIASQNYALAIGSAVAGGISITQSVVSYAKGVAQAEQNIQQKLQESRNQSVSVLNADDIDLLNAYSENKAKMCFYRCSDIMWNALIDMFYYCGYATQEQKIPTITTRYWFNFLQCKLVVNSYNMPLNILEDIQQKFEEGCTFFHNHSGSWDVAQVKENYESWILA